MSTLSHAPWIPALRDRNATPRSLAEVSLKRPSRDCASVRVSSMSSIISIGVLVQPFRASCMAALRAAFSSSVSLGMANTALTALNASVSRSITSTN